MAFNSLLKQSTRDHTHSQPNVSGEMLGQGEISRDNRIVQKQGFAHQRAKLTRPRKTNTPVSKDAPSYSTISAGGERQKKYAESESTLIALAAMQIRYGHCEEAVAYLMFVRKNNPNNESAIRLLANALIKLERLEQAEVILNELEALSTSQDTKGIYYLYRSLVRFQQAKLSEARNWFQKFKNFRREA